MIYILIAHFCITFLITAWIRLYLLGVQASGMLVLLIFFGILYLLSGAFYLINHKYGSKFWLGVNLSVYFVKEVILSGIHVAIEVVRRTPRISPVVFAFPLKVKEDWQITMLANMISLTPGTLTIDISPDRKHLYFHSIFVDKEDYDGTIRKIKEGFEEKILKLSL